MVNVSTLHAGLFSARRGLQRTRDAWKGWRDAAARETKSRLPPVAALETRSRLETRNTLLAVAFLFVHGSSGLGAGEGVRGLSPIMTARSERSVTLGCVSMLLSLIHI